MKKYVGIDFGTTNSTAAIAHFGGDPVLVKLERDFDTIPTALFFADENRSIYFGRAAEENYAGSGGRFMRSIKRILGTSLMKTSGTEIWGKNIKFDKIIEHFMQHLKNKIDAVAGENTANVVIGRPVHFRDNDPAGDIAAENEMRAIAGHIGFKNIEFQFEPIAAAFAHERILTGEKLALVIDVGGGTSDFTVIRLGPNLRDKMNRADDILANTGVRVGGNDFDRDLALKSFMPEFGLGTMLRAGINGDQIVPMPNGPYFDLATWSSVNNIYTYKSLNNIKGWLMQSTATDRLCRLQEIAINQLGHKNLDYVENAKIKLSDADKVDVVLDFLTDHPNILVTRDEFNNSIHHEINKIKKSIELCIQMADVKMSEINMIILTGGSTEIPSVKKIVTDFFPNAEISGENKLSSVGLGLALDAMRRF